VIGEVASLTSSREGEGEGEERGRTLLSSSLSRVGDVLEERGGWGVNGMGATTTLLGVEIASLLMSLSSSRAGKVLVGKGGRWTTTTRVVVAVNDDNSDPTPPPYKVVGQESDGTPAASLRCLGVIGGVAQSKNESCALVLECWRGGGT
jgi:hypothetical protein